MEIQTQYIIDRKESEALYPAWYDDIIAHVALDVREGIRRSLENPENRVQKNDLAVLAAAIMHAVSVEYGKEGLEALRRTKTVQTWLKQQ